jgi:hypothetical protein
MNSMMYRALANHDPYAGIGDNVGTRINRVSSEETVNNPTMGHSEPDHLSVALAGTAAASGPHSVAEGHITNTIKDMGTYVIAYGEATFYAASIESNGLGAHHFADTKMVITGADLVYEKTINESGQNGEVNWQLSTVEYVAIEFPGESAHVKSNELDPTILAKMGLGASNLVAIPTSALTEVESDAHAYGTNSVALTGTHELSVEDQFSFVSGLSIVTV